MERFPDETPWRCAVHDQLLDKFGLLRVYYGEGVTPQWNNAEQQRAAGQRKKKKEKCRGGVAGAAAAAAASAAVSASASASACVRVTDAKRE